ncbi:MAG: hydrogenase maturation protease [Desulfobulbaceae bacterium]|nr:hydrogenase maturation protease [Desulfobulbaceae bacterium]
MSKQWVVLGIGNPYLQDDRAGLAVVEQLRQAGVRCRTELVDTTGLEVLDRIRGFKRAVIVDACTLGHTPGTILEVDVEALCDSCRANSHAITLGTTLKTGILCFPDDMPADIRIILVEVKEIMAFNPQMSSEVEAAVVLVVARIKSLIAMMEPQSHGA